MYEIGNEQLSHKINVTIKLVGTKFRKFITALNRVNNSICLRAIFLFLILNCLQNPLLNSKSQYFNP